MKYLIQYFLRLLIFIQVLINFLLKPSKNQPRINYGSARKGDLGGPLVKIKKLNNFFPEHYWNFNIVYLISNALYLSPESINFIKRKNYPIILNQNGIYYPQWYKGDWQKENSKISHIYHSADYVFWQSNFCRKAADIFLGKRSGEGEILYNAVDTTLFSPERISAKRNFTFLITGQISKKSNYRISSVLYALKEIIKERKNIYLKIAGNIEDRKYFLYEIKKLNLENHVIFLKTYSQKDAPQLYNSADAYITMSYQDNCPSAVLEAMACALPVLFSSSGGVPELVDKNCGVGLKVNENWEETQVPSSKAIKEGMNKIIENHREMSYAARIRAEVNFDLRNWIKKHEIIFKYLLK